MKPRDGKCRSVLIPVWVWISSLFSCVCFLCFPVHLFLVYLHYTSCLSSVPLLLWWPAGVSPVSGVSTTSLQGAGTHSWLLTNHSLISFNLQWSFIRNCTAETEGSHNFIWSNKWAIITHNESWSPCTACLQWPPRREPLCQGTSGLRVSVTKATNSTCKGHQ